MSRIFIAVNDTLKALLKCPIRSHARCVRQPPKAVSGLSPHIFRNAALSLSSGISSAAPRAFACHSFQSSWDFSSRSE